MSRAQWILLHDTRVRTDHVSGQSQDWWVVAAALTNLYDAAWVDHYERDYDWDDLDDRWFD